MLDLIVQQFDTREVAAIIWFSISIIFALSFKTSRKWIFELFKSLYFAKFLLLILFTTFYVWLIVFLLLKSGVWEATFLKDTIYWFIGTALVLLFHVNNVKKRHYFTSILKDELKLIIIIEFTLNIYTFDLWIELALLPAIVAIMLISSVAGTKKELLPIKKLSDFILSIIGFLLIIFTIRGLLANFRDFASTENLRLFFLPLLLTSAFTPLLYFFALITSYETLYARLSGFNQSNPDLVKFAQWKIFLYCHLSLPKLKLLSKNILPAFNNLHSKKELEHAIRKHTSNKL